MTELHINGKTIKIGANGATFIPHVSKNGNITFTNNGSFPNPTPVNIRGPAGPDGNPIGTVISYLGFSAPKDYLICDGAIYNIADYRSLAEFFEEQFGSFNYFGGDGETTFAVPDMRNLFLRGYHGEGGEQLSGEIGVKQEGTEHVNSTISTNKYILYATNTILQNVDKISQRGRQLYMPITEDASKQAVGAYTSRPVNMAVLYCIKAVESVPAENVYSTEETRIGTWIDGKPLYRTVIIGTFNENTSKNVWITLFNLPETDIVTSLIGYVIQGQNIYFVSSVNSWRFDVNVKNIYYRSGDSGFPLKNDKYTVIIEYTKTTDITFVSSTNKRPAAQTTVQPTIIVDSIASTDSSAKYEADTSQSFMSVTASAIPVTSNTSFMPVTVSAMSVTSNGAGALFDQNES